ncbi:MAG: hypothetical protein AB8B69_27285 [Chitinophagales bacterium]
MKQFLILLAFSLILFACNNSSKENKTTTNEQSNNEWLAIPNKSVGKITPNMTEADIIEAYGKAQVKRDSLHVGEGFYIQSTVVFANTPNELRIAWEEGKTFEKMTRIIVKKPATQWHTPEGLTIGSPLQKVIDLNDTHFNFWGFEWDYAGSVSSWEGGNFDGKGLGVRLAYQTERNQLDAQAMTTVIGDQEVSSSEPILKEMQVTVSELFFYFPE